MIVLGAACASLDGIAGSARDVDGGFDGAVDAGGDGGVDAQPGVDSGAPPDAAEAGGPFCASLSPAPIFCADFDEGQPASFGWTSSALQAGGTVALDPQIARSPPNSMDSVCPSLDAGMDCYAILALHRVAPASEILAGFDLWLDGLGNGTAQLANIELLDAQDNATYAFDLDVNANGAFVVEEAVGGGSFMQVATQGSLVPQQWAHVAIDFAIVADAGSGATMTVDVGGVRVLDHHTIPSLAPGRPYFSLGVYTQDRTSEWRMHADNVTYDER